MAVLKRWGWRRRGAAWLAGFALLAGVAAGTPVPPSAEYQLKAVFLFNFAQFVEWPARKFPAPASPLIIGVLGDDPFGPYLDELVRDEKVGGRPLVVRRSRSADDLTTCHMVFVGRSETRDLDRILAHLRGQSVLTVGDADLFTRLGGMVRFAMENGKIRLRINVEAARAGDLTISSKILRPGTIVTPGKD
jgi:hypothetical protein